MSLLTRAKEVTGGLAETSKRQAQRGKLELEVRRLEGKLSTEKAAIGDALFPLLESGRLTVDAAGVAEHVSAIRSLLDEIEAKRLEIDAVKSANHEQQTSTSMDQIDYNASATARDVQSSMDKAAKDTSSPADQGGQG
jgi:hypothetical protein